MDKSRSFRLEAAFLLCLLAHVLFTQWVGRLVQMDEVFFKAAGREWAATGRFAAPECYRFRYLEPPCEDIWFAQPPVYTFLFGVFVKLAGFGPAQCVLYDELIHVLQAWLTFRLALRFEPRLPPYLCFAIGVAVLFMGTIGRSDELATCFGIAGLLPLVGTPISLGRILLSGMCLGLCAGTSAAAGAMIGLIAVSLIALGASGLKEKITLVGAWGIAAFLTLAAVVAPILIPRPDALQQYVRHAQYWYQDRQDFADLMRWGYGVGASSYQFTLLLLVVGGICFALNRPRRVELCWAALWLGPLLALVFLGGNFAYKYMYLWFIGPWLLVAATANVYALAPHFSTLMRRLLPFTVVFAAGLNMLPTLRQTAIMLALPEDQTFARNLPIVQAEIPPGSTVLTTDWWWVLAETGPVYDIAFGYPDPAGVDFIILTQNDTGIPGQIQTLYSHMKQADTARYRAYVETHFVVIRDDLNRSPVVIAGVPLQGSAYGFGSMILARREARERKE